jgi:hypothetical protein
VFRASPTLKWDLGDTFGTVAVRMPLHSVALELLRRTGPMAVTGASKHGQPAATTAANAQDQLGEAVSVYLDGGPCADSVPSTIVDLTGTVPRLLRAGVITADQLRKVVPLIDPVDEGTYAHPDKAEPADPASASTESADTGPAEKPAEKPAERHPLAGRDDESGS